MSDGVEESSKRPSVVPGLQIAGVRAKLLRLFLVLVGYIEIKSRDR